MQKLDLEKVIASYYPWRRFWARQADLSLYTLVTISLIIVFPESFDFLPDNKYVTTILFTLLYALFESVLISKCGYTTGKWVSGIKIRQHSRKLNFLTSITRSLHVALYGYFLNIPGLSQIQMILCKKSLVRNGTTTWDKAGKIDVLFDNISYMRLVICPLITLTAYFIVFSIAIEAKSIGTEYKKLELLDTSIIEYWAKHDYSLYKTTSSISSLEDIGHSLKNVENHIIFLKQESNTIVDLYHQQGLIATSIEEEHPVIHWFINRGSSDGESDKERYENINKTILKFIDTEKEYMDNKITLIRFLKNNTSHLVFNEDGSYTLESNLIPQHDKILHNITTSRSNFNAANDELFKHFE